MIHLCKKFLGDAGVVALGPYSDNHHSKFWLVCGGRDGWMASPTRWTWAWVNSGSWWWTGRPGVLRFMQSQRVKHGWAAKLNWNDTFEKACLYLHWSPVKMDQTHGIPFNNQDVLETAFHLIKLIRTDTTLDLSQKTEKTFHKMVE